MKLAQDPETFDRQEVVAKKKLQYRLIDSVKRIAGLELYEYDLTTGVLSKVQVKREVQVGLDGKPVYKTQAFQRELCLYVQATNEKNAMKKVRRLIHECNYNLLDIFRDHHDSKR